jgi:hypothetical protein
MEQERKFEVISGVKEVPDEARLDEIERFAEDYACGIDQKPKWMVWGVSPDGGRGVLYWVRPVEGDEFAARRAAKLVTELGGSATAEMTEWNEDLDGLPRYKQSDVPDFLFTEEPEDK